MTTMVHLLFGEGCAGPTGWRKVRGEPDRSKRNGSWEEKARTHIEGDFSPLAVEDHEFLLHHFKALL